MTPSLTEKGLLPTQHHISEAENNRVARARNVLNGVATDVGACRPGLQRVENNARFGAQFGARSPGRQVSLIVYAKRHRRPPFDNGLQ